jgi:DNA-binding CsgD family transcriptional regulator
VANPQRMAAALIAIGGESQEAIVAILAERRLVVAALSALLQKEPACRLVAEARGTDEVRESLGRYRPALTIEARDASSGPLGWSYGNTDRTMVVQSEDRPDVFVTAVRRAMAQALATPTVPRPRLSEREREILAQIASGRSVKEVARDCAISPKTVGNHVSNICHKFHLHHRGELVLFALHEGLTTA